MPQIEISTDQRAFLDDLIGDLEAEHLGSYGVIRYRDALQFLIDEYRDGEAARPDKASRAEAPADPDGAPEEDADAEDNGESATANDKTADEDEDEDRLNAMMSLLERYDDKWEISEGEEGKYAVTLPDETTETVRTRDDVRALLFKHYG